MSDNLRLFKIQNIDILTIFVSTILLFKFFILTDHIPLHDEVTAIERFTEWKNFLRKDGVNNHTLISIYGTIIRSLFGFDLSLFRLISFFSFFGIFFLFNRIFNNYIFSFFFLIIIFNSNFLLNAINIFRGYYIYSFLSCLAFYQIISLDKNQDDQKRLKYILIILTLLTINALYGLYISVPISIVIFFKMYKKKYFYKQGIIYFVIPVSVTYIIFFFLDGLVINNNDNLNFTFILNNFNLIFFDNIKTGFVNVFSGTPELVKNNHFQSFFFTFQRFLNGEDAISTKEFTFIFIYTFSFLILIYNLFKKSNLIDFTILCIFLFYFIIDKDPYIRVHSGTIYFCIFYIFYHFRSTFYFEKQIKKKKLINILFFLFTIVLTLFQNPNLKWQQVKPSVLKIESTIKVNNCNSANNILNQYEIWIVKNIYPNLCNSRYDFEKQINILYKIN